MDIFTNLPESFKILMQRLVHENKRLRFENAELQRKIHEISRLSEFGRHLNDGHERSQFYQNVLDLALSISHCEVGGVYLIQPESHRLTLSITAGELVPLVRARLEGAARELEIIMIRGQVCELPEYDPLLRELQKYDSLIKSVLFFPLTLDRELYGLGFLVHRHQKVVSHSAVFGNDVHLLKIIAQQVSLMDGLAKIRFDNESKQIYWNTIAALTEAIDAKDVYTAGHSQRVAEISTYIAYELGLTQKEIDTIHYGALLHDIGKIGVPETILNKKGRLTDDEFFAIKKHPVIGTNILRSIEFLEDALNIVRFHHERYDGTGYPEGLKGEGIPLAARIVGVADSWDAMTSNRSYRKALPFSIAIQEIEKNTGTQFDPFVIKALERGSFAQLRTI